MMVHDLESGRREALGRGTLPVYSATGHLLYQAGRWTYDIWALPFSLETLQPTGQAFSIVRDARQPMVASGETGETLAYLEAGAYEEWRLTWRDREGNTLGTIGEPHDGAIYSFNLSRDGRRVVVEAREDGNRDVWLHEVDRPVRTRLTSQEAEDRSPVSSPSGDRIAFTSRRTGGGGLFVVAADGGEAPTPLMDFSESEAYPTDWSEDESIVVLTRYTRSQSVYELSYLKRDQDGGYEEHPFLDNARQAKLHPDGRHIAYESTSSGRYEVYVRSFPGGGGRRRVSVSGGKQVRWRRDGKELFYVEGDTLMAVPVSTEPALTIGSPQRLFSAERLMGDSALGDDLGLLTYDVTPDGRKFVLREQVKPGGSIHIVQNWYEEFRGREQD